MRQTLLITAALSFILAGFFAGFTQNDTHFTDSKFEHGAVVREMSGSHRVLYTISKF